MDSVSSWSCARVSTWLRGLDSSLHQYTFEKWKLRGTDLLQLTSQQLDKLGVQKIGHQELILEAVEKLCSLTYSVCGETLRSVTEKLRAVAHSLQMNVQSRWRINTYDGQSTTQLPTAVLQAVVEIITAAKALFYMLQRYQCTQFTGHSSSKNVNALCMDLGSTVHKDVTVFEKEKDIISISRQLVGICDEILSSVPEAVLTHSAQLHSVDLVPISPGDQLGIEITSSASNHHYISGTAAESPAEFSEKILAGDEVIQVNDQIVVGWSRKNLVEKLQENPKGVFLLLRRAPVSFIRKEKTESVSVAPSHSKQAESVSSEREEEEEEEDETNRGSVFERVASSIRSSVSRVSVSPPDGPQPIVQDDSELLSDHSFDGTPTAHAHQQGAGSDSVLEHSVLTVERSPSPLSLDSNRARVGSCPEMVGNVEEKENKKSSTKGTRTAMSRRRVSCRELGRPDCDGWLWKKRKETSVFVTQKWQRLWFVLKGVTIYWYTSQQEEKAVGMVKIGSYSIESAGEHKRKYVFKMSHPRFQNFFFAADNVTDMSKWINCLITAIQKYKKLQQHPPDSEAECYSETDSEEDGSNSPRTLKKKVSTAQCNTLPRTLGRKNKPAGGAAVTASPAGGTKAAGGDDEMGELFNKLKEGGVSLIGQNQPITHDQLRRSFIRRNKNPVINEKIHTLRALQSTLKAKEAELVLLNKLLEDSELTPVKFRQWKQRNEELHQEIEKLAAEKRKKHVETTAEKTASEACSLSLSDGEQLVDAELPGNGEPRPENSDGRAESNSSDNYFYI
ncbi:connector enhancer of kinase suppressor of ras 1 isoform X2 [Colossoma macropomum]|uniref:connector enhancer of kinase suppressor of ras 1 isoform X2 n=1 Tax=Colossoma macropomum TaxID=42526 RepID=UPI001864F832|nr:connector enhancer of kinase suppressor of ras 1 isoform X2 [Colossoma macropomum]